MTEFEQGGFRYRIKKLNVIQQGHLSRKISPLLPPLGRPFMKVAKEAAAAKARGVEPGSAVVAGIAGDIGGLIELMGPFAEGISGMTDDAFEFVVNTCLDMVEREVSPNVWAKVWVAGSRMSPFPEFNDLSVTLPVVIKVIWDALGNFIPALLATAQQSAQEPTA